MKLITKRLILRDLQKSDSPSLVKHLNNLNVSKYLAVVPYPYLKKNEQPFIRMCTQNAQKTPRKEYIFAIELHKKKGIIGVIGIHTGLPLSNPKDLC